MEDISRNEMLSDPIFHAKVAKDGFNVHADGIEQGSVSKVKLCRVQYDDEDVEHFTLSEVKEILIDKIGLTILACDIGSGRDERDSHERVQQQCTFLDHSLGQHLSDEGFKEFTRPFTDDVILDIHHKIMSAK